VNFNKLVSKNNIPFSSCETGLDRMAFASTSKDIGELSILLAIF